MAKRECKVRWVEVEERKRGSKTIEQGRRKREKIEVERMKVFFSDSFYKHIYFIGVLLSKM